MSTELSVPKGHGLVRVAHNLRHHVPAHLWQSEAGTDYWIVAGNQDMFTASGATNISGLDSYGWVTTSLDAHTNTTTADFMSSADDTPPHILANASGDALSSPFIFGNYSHALLAGQILGHLPTKLTAEFYAAFTVASADETGTYMGFHSSGKSMSIYSDATNFLLSSSGTEDAGIAVDNAYHQWRIVVDSSTSLCEWFVDGTSQGSIAVEADAWPMAFECVASTTNRFALSWAHIWYE